ncbi:MAG: hypothetical protein LBV32_02905 [Tannerellaceae bacterium]|jgi:hypothetical protein|nr:hypothetical protein [Tannerellaceae bacterium]
MKAADFYRLMQNPSELTESTVPVLKDIVDEYPWFQAARLLYLKSLALTEDIRFPVELRKMAVLVPDRRKLFLLLEGEKYGLSLSVRGKEQLCEDDTFSLIDTFLSVYGKEKEQGESPLLLQSSVSSDYIYWAMSAGEEREGEEQTAAIPLQHQELIDRFIRTEKVNPAAMRLKSEELPPASTLEPLQTPGSEEELDESFFTETLAQIYVKQKRYDKALQIIKKLSLNYPEKSIYFADQIRFLENMIINTKK